MATANEQKTETVTNESSKPKRIAVEKASEEQTLKNKQGTEANTTEQKKKPVVSERSKIEGSAVKRASLEQHYPDYFSHHVPMENLIRRGNLLTVHSGCSIATWSYNGKRHTNRPLNECRQHAKSGAIFAEHRLTPENATLVQPYDSIYVPMVKLEHFVNETLPHIQKDFVLITGQASLPEGPIPLHVYDAVLTNPQVCRWFLQNLSLYAYDPHHPKVSRRNRQRTTLAGTCLTHFFNSLQLTPFPYGMAAQHSATMLAAIKKSFHVPKDYLIHWPVQKTKRNQLEQEEVYNNIQKSRYVISPSDSRPESHQHYEAIAFGTKPITSLDAYLYRHLEGSVIFNETDFNLTVLEETLPKFPLVNRRLAFEEYWMEYIEREVGHSMRWWDPSLDERTSLDTISGRVMRAFGGNGQQSAESAVSLRGAQQKQTGTNTPPVKIAREAVSSPHNHFHFHLQNIQEFTIRPTLLTKFPWKDSLLVQTC